MMGDDTFRLTPLDVRKTEFRKVMRGYDQLGVDDFRSRVADEMERLVREKLALEERLAALESHLTEFRQRERAMNDALVTAQELRAETREHAEREAQMVVREAESEAERRLDRARREVDRLQAAAEQLYQKYHSYLTSLRAIVERQRAELETLATSEATAFGKVAGSISPGAADAPRESRAKSSSKWVKSAQQE